ncbi:MAG TPA: DNA repair protein RecN [Rhodothermales bacterium]|nr:DNA repair protein RecN [Rhodothermales bacterium]
MLRSLSVRDYALIEELEVEFDSGLNVITGETGAGKSILLGALKLLLGERASTEAVRSGAKKAVIEGVFDNADSGRMPALLRAHGVEPNPAGVLIIRREVAATHSRAFLNDTPTTLDVLREVAGNTIDLHGQHQHQGLLRTETHVELLDAFGGLGGLVETYRRHLRETAALVKERDGLKKREAELRQQKEFVAYQIEEIDRVAPRPLEVDELEAERRILENAERLYEATASIYAALAEGDDALYDRLVVARNQFQDLARIDTAFEPMMQDLRSAEVILNEATQFVQDYNARIEFNPERLDEIRERLGELDYLARKYGGTVEAVLVHREEIGKTFELATNFEAALGKLGDRIETAQDALSRAAYRLSQKRHEVSERIEESIGVELATLGMPHARFVVSLRQEALSDGWIRFTGAPQRLAAYPEGADRVEFYFTANPGEDPRPLAKVASGGEVSRVMLALKTVLAKSERLPILVFDEIDTGISGAVARRAGESMRRLAAYHQIIAITHLPQIASLGDTHFIVQKEVSGGRSRTHIRRLDDETERAEAVARLLSGEVVSEAALASARELIEEGRELDRDEQ